MLQRRNKHHQIHFIPGLIFWGGFHLTKLYYFWRGAFVPTIACVRNKIQCLYTIFLD